MSKPLDASARRNLPRTVVLVLMGFAGGAASILNWLSGETALAYHMVPLGEQDLEICVALAACVTIALFFGVDAITRRVAASLPDRSRSWFLRMDLIAWLPALLPILGMVGIRFVPAPAILLLVLGLKALFYLLALPPRSRQGVFESQGWLAFLFLVSGFAALIYQIVWQRTLFSLYGVNIESITVVVTIFMFGLGVGSLFGGWISTRLPGKAPTLFMACEVTVGAFGVASIPLMEAVGALTKDGSLVEVTLAVFGLLFLPTFLMGATLPILVAHLDRYRRNVGGSVGVLYCINTVGSAIACFLTADVLFVCLGQQASVLVAASCNFLVGLLVWRFARRLARTCGQVSDKRCEPPAASSPLEHLRGRLPGSLVVLSLAAASGYISLSQEIVWMRLVSYMSGGKPTVFAHVLGFFLIGVAAGAWYGGRECEKGFPRWGHPMRFVGAMLFLSGFLYVLSVGLMVEVHSLSWPLGHMMALVAIVSVAFSLGGVFPVLCHLYARPGFEVGGSVSRTYMANILGSTAGPLLTGFVWMEETTTPSIIRGLSIATIFLGGLAWLAAGQRRRLVGLVVSAIGAGSIGALHDPLLHDLFARLQFRGPVEAYRHLFEDRSGVVAAVADAHMGDRIYGGGVYDGRMNMDPVLNSNRIDRCYLIPALHKEPKDILVIGLSAGSWTRVLTNWEGTRSITAVEICRSYLDLIPYYPEVAPLLTHPKVTIEIDDGRRWLARNPLSRFDVIVQNTTFHWRSNSTHVLSREYFELCKSHLNDGGVVWVNTTGSREVAATLARIFRHVVTYQNFVAASDRPFSMSYAEKVANLRRFTIHGRPVFDDPATWSVMDSLARTPLEDLGETLRQATNIPTITDDNMWVEYKMDRWWSSDKTWARLFGRLRAP